MSNDRIDRLARALAESLPQGLRSMREDLEANFRGVLKAGLGRLDLVTREEFEVQEAVLARTRAKLDALETRLDEFEADARGPSPAGEPAAPPASEPAAPPAGSRKKRGKTSKKAAKKAGRKAGKKTARKGGGKSGNKAGGTARGKTPDSG